MCDEYCTNHGCNSGPGCPVRAKSIRVIELEHWQECPVCQPGRFDADGNRLPPEPTPLQAARAQIEKAHALLRQALAALEAALSDDQPYIAQSKEMVVSIKEFLE